MVNIKENSQSPQITERHPIKWLHIFSPIWFVASSLYLIVYKLRQADVEWWVILSLSTSSIALFFLLFMFYMFAIFRGATRILKTEKEHPLSVSAPYMIFYYLSPLLGGLVGAMGMIGEKGIWEYFLGSSFGTLVAAFGIWIIIDPAISLIELMLPGSRQYRRERAAQIAMENAAELARQQEILARHEARQKNLRSQWDFELREEVNHLALLFSNTALDARQREHKAVDIGVRAWQTGGLDCMQWLYDRASEYYKAGESRRLEWRQISAWWDGIGAWTDRPEWEKMRLAE